MTGRLLGSLIVGLIVLNTPDKFPGVGAVSAFQAQNDPDLGTRRFPITKHKDFVCFMRLLQRIIDRAGKTGTQHLYVSPVGHDDERKSEFVRIYWPDDKSILIITFPIISCTRNEVNAYFELSWYDTKGRINLETDVVPTRKDVGSSTYLVDKPWVDKIIQDCRKNGYLAVIQRPDAPK
jgi:hypothetical protein